MAKQESKLKVFLEMIKFEHTIFALPFAYIGAFLGAQGLPTLYDFFWITLAMVGARTAAMSLNRLLDRHIDAENPRTAGRAIPAGLISVKEVWVYTILSFALLIISSLMLNMLAVKLMPIAVFFLVIYSYMKRISWTCHLVLGIAIGLAPMGSWVAVTGTLELPALLMGLAVATWVAGFDVVYACQDYKYDKEKGLHSIPSRFGIPSALIIAKVLHILAVIFLASVGLSLNLGLFYWVGVLIAALILVYEHRIVNPRDLSKINIAFFNMNGILSVIVFVFTLLDLFL